MSEPEDDGPILPLIPGGMPLRDWFAGQALAGLLACPDFDLDGPISVWAKAAYRHADAMLAERRK